MSRTMNKGRERRNPQSLHGCSRTGTLHNELFIRNVKWPAVASPQSVLTWPAQMKIEYWPNVVARVSWLRRWFVNWSVQVSRRSTAVERRRSYHEG
jgi:hypothetical protein